MSAECCTEGGMTWAWKCGDKLSICELTCTVLIHIMNNEELPSLTLSSKKRIKFIFMSLYTSYSKYKNLILWFYIYSSVIYSSCDWASQALCYKVNTLRTGTASFFFFFFFAPFFLDLPLISLPTTPFSLSQSSCLSSLRHTANSHLYLFYIWCCKFQCYCLHTSPLLPPRLPPCP